MNGPMLRGLKFTLDESVDQIGSLKFLCAGLKDLLGDWLYLDGYARSYFYDRTHDIKELVRFRKGTQVLLPMAELIGNAGLVTDDWHTIAAARGELQAVFNICNHLRSGEIVEADLSSPVALFQCVDGVYWQVFSNEDQILDHFGAHVDGVMYIDDAVQFPDDYK